MSAPATKDLADSELIRSASGGSKIAFTALMTRYEDVVYGFARKLCRDREKAEETLQDTLISVYRKLGSFDGRSKFSTWLYAIVSNHCLMRHRRRKLDDITESLDDPPSAGGGRTTIHPSRWAESPADLLLHKELQSVLERSIKKLPVHYRVVFVLRDIEGKTAEQTAEILKISREATKSRLRRARAFLRKELDPYFSLPGGHA